MFLAEDCCRLFSLIHAIFDVDISQKFVQSKIEHNMNIDEAAVALLCFQNVFHYLLERRMQNF